MNSSNKQSSLLTILSIVISVVALAVGIYSIWRNEQYAQTASANELKMSMHAERLEHCHDNQIIPCDDENLQKWNDSHPDQKFHWSY